VMPVSLASRSTIAFSALPLADSIGHTPSATATRVAGLRSISKFSY
jgi:hypothetical protein